MLSLILLLILGSGIAFLSLQNTQLVTVTFLTYSVSNIPLYFVIIGSLMVGILMAYVLYLSKAISSGLTIRGQRNKLKHEKLENAELTKSVHQLELKNAGLKKESQPDSFDPKSL